MHSRALNISFNLTIKEALTFYFHKYFKSHYKPLLLPLKKKFFLNKNENVPFKRRSIKVYYSFYAFQLHFQS